jgi:hypothetical protein
MSDLSKVYHRTVSEMETNDPTLKVLFGFQKVIHFIKKIREMK